MNAPCPPSRDELAYPTTHRLGQDARPRTTPNQTPRDPKPLDELLVRQIRRQCAVTRAANVLPELRFVGGEDGDAFTPARDGHVPLLPVRGRFDGRIRKEDVIDSLALGCIRCDCESAHELPVIPFENASVLQLEAATVQNP